MGRSSLRSYIGNGFHFLVIAGFQIFVMRRASIVLGNDYGLFAHLYALAAIGLGLTLMGVESALMKFLAICAAKNARREALSFLLRAVFLRASLILIVSLGLGTYLFYSSEQWGLKVILSVCLFFSLQGLLLLQHAALQGLGKYPWLATSSCFLFFGILVPAKDLSSIFWMLSAGYACSFITNSIILTGYFIKKGDSDTGLMKQATWSHLARVSLILSIAGLCMTVGDNSAIILLKAKMSPEMFSVLALAFSLALYPARMNALSLSFILPKVSEVVHLGDLKQVRDHFHQWVLNFRYIGPLLLLPLLLGAGPFIRSFFAPELKTAVFYAMVLVLANIARITTPISMSILVARGRPGLFTLCNAVKAVTDIVLILFLREKTPAFLVIALTASWIFYANLIYICGRLELSLTPRPEWFITLFIPVMIGCLFTPFSLQILFATWIVFVYLAIKNRRGLMATFS